MKLFAKMVVGEKLVDIDVWDVIDGRKTDPKKWGPNAIYYSTHARPEHRCLMNFAKSCNNKAFFKYKKKDTQVGTGEGHEESITHETCKEIISKLPVLNFKAGNQFYKIYVTDVSVEFPIELNENKYVIDIMFKFKKSEPEWLFLKWKGILAVEIFYSHQTGPVKKKDLYDSGIPVFEVPVHKSFDLDKDYPVSREVAYEKINFIRKCYEEKIYAQLISNPSSKEYLEMLEIEKLNGEIKNLTQTTQTLGNQIQQQNKTIDLISKENSTLKGTLAAQTSAISRMSAEMQAYKGTIWYKLYKWLSKNKS